MRIENITIRKKIDVGLIRVKRLLGKMPSPKKANLSVMFVFLYTRNALLSEYLSERRYYLIY